MEPMAEVLDLTGAQDTADPHQMHVAPPHRVVGMATGPGTPPWGPRAPLGDAVVLFRRRFGQPHRGLAGRRGPPRHAFLWLAGGVVEGNRAI